MNSINSTLSIRVWILVAILFHLLILIIWQENPFAISAATKSVEPKEKRITFDLVPAEKRIKQIYTISTPPVDEISDLPPAETVSPEPSLEPTEAAPDIKSPWISLNPDPITSEKSEERITQKELQSAPHSSPSTVHIPDDFVLKSHADPTVYEQNPDKKKIADNSNDPNNIDSRYAPNVDATDSGIGDHWETVGGTAFDVTDFTGFEWYARTIKDRVQRRWYAPYAFTHLGSMSGDCIVEFRIQKDGTIVGPNLLDSTKYKALDDPALRAIQFAAPFPPLPQDFPEEDLGVRFKFSYILRGK